MLFPMVYFLKEDEQLLVESFTERWTINGPGTWFARPLLSVKKRKGLSLGPTEYVLVQNALTGELSNYFGPSFVFLQAAEHVLRREKAVALKTDEFIRLIDQQTGVIRVERGEASVYLRPTEEVLQEPTTSLTVDEHNAVLVRDLSSGELSLVTEPQMFVPAPTQEVIDTRQRILLADHEAVVIRDSEGKYEVRQGTSVERAFFLDPYSTLVEFCWSAGIHKDERSLRIVRIDTRPKFMWYEFDVRTRDNVELIVGITFFWQIADVPRMAVTTDDAPGDLCSHARSMIIQAVSQVTLEQFLGSFNQTVRDAVLRADDPFYADRGAVIHAVEVRSIGCKDPDTQAILQEIIQETTNRLNQLQKQTSENEVKVEKLRGEIEAEQIKGDLLQLQREHARIEATATGDAEAQRVSAFLTGLDGQIALSDKLAVFNLLRKKEILDTLSQGSAQLFFTPADVDLRIETAQLARD